MCVYIYSFLCVFAFLRTDSCAELLCAWVLYFGRHRSKLLLFIFDFFALTLDLTKSTDLCLEYKFRFISLLDDFYKRL